MLTTASEFVVDADYRSESVVDDDCRHRVRRGLRPPLAVRPSLIRSTLRRDRRPSRGLRRRIPLEGVAERHGVGGIVGRCVRVAGLLRRWRGLVVVRARGRVDVEVSEFLDVAGL